MHSPEKVDHPQEISAVENQSRLKPEPTPWRYNIGSAAIRLFFTCWLIYALHFATNTVREIYPALSLGDHLSFDVSEYSGLHPDIFELPGGGAYINNNPGASILGAIPYALARPVIDVIVHRVEAYRSAAGIQPPQYDTIYPMAEAFYLEAYQRGLDVKFGLAAGVMQVFLMAPLSALSVVLMFYILAYLTGSVKKGLLLSLVYAFATPIFYRTAQLNHNLLAAYFAFFSFVCLWRPWDDPKNPGKPRYFIAGALAGFTVVLDYSGLIVVFVMMLYAFLRWRSFADDRKSWRDLAWFALGVSVSGAILLAYQWLVFGNPFYPSQHYMPPTQYSIFGYRGMDVPKLDLLWNNTFGYRYGLFLSAPILLLALYFPAWFRKGSDNSESPRLIGKLETFIILLFTVCLLLFTAANQFSRLQFNSGIRHMVPAVPFLFLIAADVLLLLPSWLAVSLSVIATYWSWSLVMYRDVEQRWGIFESLIDISTNGPRLPWLTTLERLGYLPGWISAWQVLILLVIIVLAIWNFRFPHRETGQAQRIEP